MTSTKSLVNAHDRLLATHGARLVAGDYRSVEFEAGGFDLAVPAHVLHAVGTAGAPKLLARVAVGVRPGAAFSSLTTSSTNSSPATIPACSASL
jgi:hypothetical protein